MQRTASLYEHDAWNRREFTRVPLALDVVIDAGRESRVNGRTRDLSLKGLFVRCADPLPVGTTCTARMHFAGREHELSVEAEAKVARSEGQGVGLEFTAMGQEALRHLRNLVFYNAPDPVGVEREFRSHVGLKRRAG